MSDNQYTYAVARIRSKELALLSASFLEQLLAAKSHEECIQLLHDRGWGGEGEESPEAMLQGEKRKTWELIAELVDDMSVFDAFLYANDYHNLKAAIKEICTENHHPGIYISQGTIEPEVFEKALREKNYSLLPEGMREVAEEALQVLLHTRDGQLCDIMVDKAALEAIYKAGKAEENELLNLYGELTVVTADIKVAVRAQRTGKDMAFLKRALAPCDTLDIERLSKAAVTGFDELCAYLETTAYAQAVSELRTSPSAFERWCDNLIIQNIKPQLYNPFTIGPLAAYILARENEIKTVRIVLSGKVNDLSEDSIRERVREMYV